mmetsp:Transcript_6183/g.11416  ORF Transcript_6183/g.11416 Transcript_6183/m.11416 type:complete len:416 (+) Transcript_6183:82-1329(+)
MTVLTIDVGCEPDEASTKDVKVDVLGDLPFSPSSKMARMISRDSGASQEDDPMRTISRNSFGFNRMISSESFKRCISSQSSIEEEMQRQPSGASSQSIQSHVPEILSPMSGTRKQDLFIFDGGDLKAKYELKQLIGKGGYGVVHKGIAKDTKQLVAIKTIEMDTLSSTSAYGKEMIVAWMMTHPNLVSLIDCFSDEKTLQLVMDHLSGRTIHSLVQSRKKYGEPRGLPSGQQEQFAWAMLSGISYLHHHKIAHRDCKTENFMQETDRETATLKLIDFGLAMRVPKDQLLTEKVGTPEFAAPEVARGSYNEKCDIWSIGVVAYIICVGFQPFQGKTALEVMKKVRDNEAKFNPRHWDLVKPHLKELVKDMLVKDPNARTSAKKLADQNQAWFAKVKDLEKLAASQNEQPMKCCIIS